MKKSKEKKLHMHILCTKIMQNTKNRQKLEAKINPKSGSKIVTTHITETTDTTQPKWKSNSK